MSLRSIQPDNLPDLSCGRSDLFGVDLIARPRLIDEIQSEPLRPVVLLAAPAGSGKTALLTQWLDAQRAGPPEAAVWVTCEPGETGPAAFWRTVADALDDAGVPAPHGARDPAGPYDRPRQLLHRMSAAPHPAVLILDDFHLVTDPETLRGVGYLAGHTSARFRLFISTRSDPDVHLSRLRLAGRLLELRLPDLAMTTEEVRELLSHSGPGLQPDVAAELRKRTEGWVAGVQLCLMSATSSGDPDRIGTELSKVDSSIAAYVMDEVVPELDSPLRTFLVETSIVDVITPSWADQLTGRLDGAANLRALARQTGFVASPDDDHGHYRYHPLLAGVLRNELRLTDRTRHDELQTRAADLLLRANHPSAAVLHAVAAENWDVAAAAAFATVVHTLGADHDQIAGVDATQAPASWLVGHLVAFVTIECLVGLGQYEQARSVAEQQLTSSASPAQRGHLLAWIRERELLSHVIAHGLRGVQADPRLACEWERHEELASAAAAVPFPGGAVGQLRVRCLLTAALVELHVGHEGSASRLLNLVLDQVATTGWRLPFHELGDSVRVLLKAERDRINDHSELVTHLLHELHGHDTARASSVVAPLSDREAEVLQYLPTALDREELCTALFISKNTLKSHLRSIYRKLGADSRREAVHKARSLDLL